eukprot:gene37314-46044_t
MAVTMCLCDFLVFHYWCFLHNEHHANCEDENDLHSPHRLGFFAVQFSMTDEKGVEIFDRVMAEVGKKAPYPNKTLKTRYDADLSWLTAQMNIFLVLIEPVFWMLLAQPLGFHTADLLLWICLLPRLATKHEINATNSFCHLFGTRPYCGNGHAPYPHCLATNNWYIALLNGGEGWHNNHHAFAVSARHGLLWWEFDWCWLMIRMFAELGLIWDVVEVCDEIRLAKRDPKVAVDFKQKYTIKYPRDKTSKAQ